ncbi:MAG: YDG domain-containing protein [Rubrivivax sp.]|nr:YDG domain-containing protein [Rubrivivax sp.]
MSSHASMNRIFRLVWNDTLGVWVAVAETARRKGKGGARVAALMAPLVAALGLGVAAHAAGPPAPTQLPTGGNVVAGSAAIVQGSGAVLSVEQATQRAIVEWNTFNLGSAAQLNFNQPGRDSATLNRVLDSNPSQILGRITAPGQVFLSNPNGVTFGKTASVDVGSLTATTHDISNADFSAGKNTFARNGATGNVVNEGELRAAIGGYIALLAPEVRNSGVVVARLGTVVMAAGEAITLSFAGNHLAGITVQPSTIRALVDNRGAVLAPGGLIILSAQAVDRLQGGVVRNVGALEATGLSSKGGRIVLEASDSVVNSGSISASVGADGSPAGSVAISAPAIVNSGTISAAGVAAAAQDATVASVAGGSIALVGTTIVQTPTGRLDVSGASGGTVKLQATQDIELAGTVTAAAEPTVDAAAGSAVVPQGQGGGVELKAGHNVTLASAIVDASGISAGGSIVVQGGGQAPLNPPGDNAPTVALLGTTELRSSSRRGRGGSVTLTGDRVGLFDTSAIDVSGAAGGGSVFVGGGFHGTDPSIANARQTLIGTATRIDASATQSGEGGQVAVWADGQTVFAGHIAARGGAVSGDGGAVEVSGKESLRFVGLVDAGASHGKAGTLLLDPRDITVASGGGAALTDVDAFTDTPSIDQTIDPNAITASANAGTAVTLQANNDITINSAIVTVNASGTGGSLTFRAGRSITLNANIDSDDGAIIFTANDAGAGVDRAAGAATFVNNSLIDAGAGTVTITMDTKGQSGSISAGQVTAANLSIAHNGPTAGAAAGRIDLGETTIDNNLTISADSARNVTNLIGSVIVRKKADINVGTGDVTVDRVSTDFNVIGLTAGNVTLNDTNAMRLGSSNISGSLTVTTRGPLASSTDGITASAAVVVGGLATLTATSGGFGYADPYIDLQNADNDFQGGLALNVPATGATGTGGYAKIRDINAITVNSSNTAAYFQLVSGGAATLGTTTATGSSVSVTTTSGGVSTGTTVAGTLTINGGTSAVDLGATTVSTDLTVSTTGAITDSGTLVVPQQTILTAGAANDITLDSASNNFNSVRIISARNTTLVDINAINFGAYNTNAGGYSSRVYGALNVTAGGDISQTRSDNDGYSQITVDGATTFTANNASAPINLYLGSSDPFGGGESNTFAGGVTLTRNNNNTGFSNVRLRNTSSAAGVLTGLTSVGTLNDVFLRFDNAPSVALPGMTLAGSLKVAAPSVLNTATTPGNTISQSGPIVVAGSTIMAAGASGDIVLTDAGNNFNQFGIANTGARDLNLVDVNAVVLYAAGYHQYVTRNFSVTAGGNISDLGNDLAVPGIATFSAGTSNVMLTNMRQAQLTTLAIPAANDVTILPWTNLALNDIAITGSLNLSTRNQGYALTQNAGTSVVTGAPATNTTTLNNYGNITLANTGNVLGNLAIGNAGNVTIRENDAITQASAWSFANTNGGTNSSRYAVNLTTSNDQGITLDKSGNVFGNLTVTQVNSGAGSAGAVYVREDSDSYFGMTQGGAWSVHGTTRLDSGAYSMALTNPSNVFGPLQVLGATGLTNALASSVTIYAKASGSADAITDVGGPGPWTAGTGVGASVKLSAYDATGATAGGGNVNLTNPANVLGDLYVKATDVTITENHSITDGASTSWNPAGDTGWVTTGTTNLIVANPIGKTITLDNLTNVLGPVGVNTTGTGILGGVLITDNSNLTQAAVWNVGAAPVTLDARNHAIDLSIFGNVLGALTISTVNGSPTSVAITENDAITQGSVWALSGVPLTLVAQNGNAITLTNAANILGNLALTGGTVSITENDSITQGGAWTTTGTTTLNVAASGGAGITLTHAGNVLGAIAIAGTPNAVSITENDDITQASAWVQGATPFTLNAGAHDLALSQAANQLGDLTLIGQNATVTEAHAAGITDGGAWTIPGSTTLTAGSANPILLNATPASDFGTVSIVSASNVDIADINGIVFGTSTIAAGGTLAITAGGAITQTGAITAPSLRLIGTGSATLTNASNNVATLAAGFSGGDLVFTDSGSFAVGVVGGTSGVTIGANDVTLTSVNGTVTGLSNVNASSSSLAITTGTALSLPQMSISGAQTFTASTLSGTGITLTASVTSTAAGAINFMSPVTLASDLTVQSTNSAINFADTLAGGTNQLNVNAGTGLVDLRGAVTALGSTGDAAAALALTSSGASFHSTIGANNGLAITGPAVFADTVTLADGNAASVFTGLVTLGKVGGMDLSGYDGMTFNGGVLLQNGPATINSNNSALAFQTAGTVSGPYGLTLNSGTQSLIGLNRMGSDLTGLSVTALSPTIPSGGVSIAGPQSYTATGASTITIAGNVTSTAAGAINFNSPVTMGAGATVTSSDSNVVFAGTVDGNHDLTVNSGTGTKTFTGAVGAAASLGDGTGASIILQGAGATTFASTLQARSGITAAGPVAFNNNMTLANGDTGSIFTGLVTVGGSSGATFGSFDGIAFHGGLALTGGPVSIASNGSSLAFGGAVTGAQNLTLNALLGGAGTVTGLDQIGFMSSLTGLNITAQTLNLPSTGLAVAGPMAFTAAGGITLNGAVGNSATPATGQIDLNSPVTLATGAVTVTTRDAAVNFNGSVNGAQALTVNAGTGTTTFGGAVGATTAPTSVTTDAGGTTAINGGGIRTTGAQTWNDALTLGAAATLSGVDISFNGTLNGANALVVNDSGVTRFAGIVGGTTALTSLTTDAPGTVLIDTTALTTSGAQTYNDAITLGADAVFSGLGLTFGASIDGAHSITTNAGSGALRFNGAIGGTTPLTTIAATGGSVAVASATTSGTQTYTGAGGVTLGGTLTTMNSAVTVTGPTTLTADSAIATSGGNIVFSGATSSINGAHGLTLAAGTGNVVLGGVVGGVAPLTGLTVSGFDLTLPGIGTVGDGNQSYTALNNITLNQSRTLNAPISFVADADGNGAGSFILLNGVSLTASNNSLTIRAADLDLQGNSTLSSGNGLTTVSASNGRNIALGGVDAAGQMTITGSELSRISSSGGLNLETSGTGWIRVNGLTQLQSQNITGTLGLNAQGTGDVSFITAPSTFNALRVDATGGPTNIGVNLTTTNDAIEFVTPVSVSGASTINSGGGNIGFDSTLAVDNNLTISTGNGALSFGGAVGSNQTLTLNLGGGSVAGLGQLQSALTGITVNSTSGITLPAFTINGPQVYNTGTITVSGNLGGVGIAFNNLVDVAPGSGSALTMNAGTGTLAFNNLVSFNASNMSLTGDEINFSRAVTGSGSLAIQPFTGSRNVAVGGSTAPGTQLNLTAAELAWLPIGTLSSLSLGSGSGTGALDIAGVLNAPGTPLTLNGGGGITQSGGSVTSGALTLYAAGNAITLANAANAFGAVALNGTPSALSLSNSLDITQLGSAAWHLGSASVTMNAGTHDITLNNVGNTFGTLFLTGANVQITETASTDIGASTISKNLTLASSGGVDFSGALTTTGNVSLSSTGVITQSAPLTVGGNLDVVTTVAAGDVTIDNSGASATNIGNTLVGGSYVLTAAGDPVSQAAGATLQVRGNLTVTGSSIVLGGAGNLIGGVTALPTTNTAVLRQSGVITLGDRSDAGNLTVISERTNRSFGSALVSGDAIVLNNAANNVTGTISVSASPPSIVLGADLQTGIVQSANTLVSVAGVASFTAEASGAGSLGIVLHNAGNSFGTLQLSGTTVGVTNSATGLTTIGSALATTSLTLNTAGGLAQSGPIITPTLAITVNGPVLLNNVANDVNTVALNSGGHAISYVDANDVTVSSLDARGGSVGLSAGGAGSLSQSGALLNVGALSVNAGGAVTLDNAANTIAALVASTAGTGLQLLDSAGGLTVTGIVRSTGGDITVRTSGGLEMSAGSRLEAGAGNLVVSTEGVGNFINGAGASALMVGTGKRWLVYSETPDLVAGAHTVKDGLTSSFRHYGDTYASYLPAAVTEAGNGFVYGAAAATLTVSATVTGAASHIYGDAPTGSLSYAISSGLQDSEDNIGNIISGGAAAYSAALANTMNAGSYGIRYTGGLTSNYALVADSNGVTYTVTPAALTYTANAATRAYGAADPALSGGINGFKLGQNASILGGTANWSTAAVVGSNVGQYAIGGSGYTVGANYSFAQASSNAIAFDITRAGLVVTTTGASKTYDGTLYSGGNGVGYSAFANGENASVLGGTLAYAGTAQGARNAGSYVLTSSGLSSGNYAISYVNGTLVVGEAGVTLTSSDIVKTYDGTRNATGTAMATAGTQLFGSDSASGGTYVFTNANAGTANKTVAVSGVSLNDGNGGNNYTVAYVDNTGSTIDPARLTVATSNVTKTYDGTLAASGTATVVSGTLFTNVSNGNVRDSLSGASFAFSNSDAGTGTKNVSTNDVNVSDGNGGGNYLLSYADNTTSTINRKALTFVGTVVEKSYDGSNGATLSTSSLTGFVGSETVVATAGSATFADKNAGVGKTVTIGGIALGDGSGGGLASNYVVSPTATALGTIDPKLLTVNATVANKVYDGDVSASLQGFGLTGFVGSETVTGVFTGSASFADKHVGTNKAVTVTGINLLNGSGGGLASNYAVSANANSNANITPATLQVAGVVAVDKVYDGTLNAVLNTQAAVITGVISGDQVQVGSITGAYLTKDVGVNKAIGTGTFVLGGADAGDYTLVQPTGLTANITPRALDVSAVGIDKAYDRTTVALVALGDNRLAGDLLTLTSSNAFLDPNVGSGKYISVTGITLAGTDALNYTANGSTGAFATVTAAMLGVTATGTSKVYDATTGASVTLAGNAFSGDVLTLAYASAAFDDKNVGTAKIVTVGGITVTGAAVGNYTVGSVTTTTADITPATISQVTGISAVDKVYDGTTTATLSTGALGFVGMFGGDSLTASATSAAFVDKNAGVGKAVTIGGLVLGGTDAGNYVVSAGPTSSAATITPALLGISASAADKVYDATTAASASLVGNALGTDVVDVGFGSAVFSDRNVGMGKTVTVGGISLSGADAGNYMAAATATADADITPASLVVNVFGVDRVYDATNAASVELSHTALGADMVGVGYGSATFADKNVGSGKIVSVGGIVLSGADAGNYTAHTTASTTASIARAALTVGAVGTDKVYDTTTAATVQLVDNRLGDDAIVLGYVGAAFADKNVGTGKAIAVDGITIGGADAGNYTANVVATASANITPATLTMGAIGIDRVYDATTGASVTLTGNPLGSDDLTLSYGSAAFTDKNVGSAKLVNVGGIALGGVDALNYAVDWTATTTASITPAVISQVTGIRAADKMYDGGTDATLATASLGFVGLLGSDSLTATAVSAVFADKNAGVAKSVTISGIALGGADAGNYTLVSTRMASTGTITPAALAVTARGTDRVYDATTATSVTLADGRFAGDVLSVGYTSAAFADKHAGLGKLVNVDGITVTGIDAGNYSLAGSLTTTADIARAALQVGATGIAKVYDAGLGASVTLADDRNAGDVLTLGYGAASFADKNVGTGKAVAVSGIFLSGADADNYTSNGTATTTADIGKANLVLNAVGIDRVYDTTTAATVRLVDNRLGDDNLVLDYTGAKFADKNAGVDKAITVTGITAGGADAGNYNVATSGSATGTIGKAELAVSATAQTRVYDATTSIDVTLTDTPLGNDAVDVGYAMASLADKNAGLGKTVVVTGLRLSGADAGNYSVSDHVTTAADVTPAGLTPGAVGLSKLYDGTDRANVVLNDDRITGDDLLLAYGTATFDDGMVGTARAIAVDGIRISGGADQGNYVLTGTTATTTGEVSAYADSWSLTPQVPLPLTMPTTSPPIALLDGQLPAGFGEGSVGGAESAGPTGAVATQVGVSGTASTDTKVGVANGTGSVGMEAGAAAVAGSAGSKSATGAAGASDRGSSGGAGTATASTGATAAGDGATAAAVGSNVSNPGSRTSAGDVITVALVRNATGGDVGMVSVVVPAAMVASGEGYGFALPAQLAELPGGGGVRVTLPDGAALPSWLRYMPGTKSFAISGNAAGVLPIEVLVRIGNRNWMLVITERTGR